MQSIPLVGVYCFQDKDSYSVFVLSRKLDHFFSKTDDGYTPVTLRLPFAKVKKITLHRLARLDGSPADPRDSNLEEMKLGIVSTPVNTAAFSKDFMINEKTGGGKNGLPPGGIYLYVFEK